MEKLSPLGGSLLSRFSGRIKILFSDLFWFLKYMAIDIYHDLKRLASNRKPYIYLIVFLFFYSLIYLDNKLKSIIIWVILLLAILLDIWKVGDWKDYQRKEKKKKYFSQEHPEKISKEKDTPE